LASRPRAFAVQIDATAAELRCCGRVGLICLLGFALVGCDFDHDVNRYRAVLDGPKPPAVGRYDPRGPLSLRRALVLANADDEAIGISGENYIQALATKMKDAGTFLPTLSLAPTYSLSKGGASGFSLSGLTSTTGGSTTTGSTTSGGQTFQITGGTNGVSHSFSVPLGVSATGSLSNVSTYQAAGESVDQLAQTLLDERETILLQVAQSYYGAMKAEQQVRVFESSLRFKGEKVRDQQARLRLGAVRPLDVAQSESDLAATRVSLTQARTDVATNRSALARLMGVSEVAGELTDAYDPPAEVAAVEAWQDDAHRRRPDLVAAERAVDAAKFKVESAIREYFPTVSIDFNYFLYNDPHSSQTWTNAISGSIPIFSALSIEADVRAAWSQYRAAGLTREQTRRTVTDDVNEQYANLHDAREQVAELKVEVAASQKAVDLAERGYQLGSASNLDRLTQQDNLLTAQLNLVNEQFSEKSSYLALLRASGALAGVLR
jgi:outer membrane protein TolC